MSAGVWALAGSLIFSASILAACVLLVLEVRGKLPA